MRFICFIEIYILKTSDELCTIVRMVSPFKCHYLPNSLWIIWQVLLRGFLYISMNEKKGRKREQRLQVYQLSLHNTTSINHFCIFEEHLPIYSIFKELRISKQYEKQSRKCLVYQGNPRDSAIEQSRNRPTGCEHCGKENLGLDSIEEAEW